MKRLFANVLGRREFLVVSMGIAGTLTARLVFGKDTKITSVRAAVVIGVNKTGDLPPLKGAVSGADKVANWLTKEGFEVTLITDENKKQHQPVTVERIFNVIKALVHRGTLEQLVIYFSGHGFISGYSEHWLLSNAPENPNEAISLRESIELAKDSGIPNVVFISDACRSRANTLGIERVHGSLIFPNKKTFSQRRSDVDVFLATLIGDPSFEVPVDKSVAQYQGIYTSVFLSAFRQPDKTMVRKIKNFRVVPNNKLRQYLEREVRIMAETISIKLNQMPDSQVVSGDDTYIGKVTDAESTEIIPPSDSPTIVDLANAELSKVGVNAGPSHMFGPTEEAIVNLAKETGYLSARDAIVAAQSIDQAQIFDTGFFISGARLESVHTSPWMKGEILVQDQIPALQIQTNRPGSVLLAFDNGSCTVLAVLPGFIGKVVVDGGGVSNVSYDPSVNNFRRSEFVERRTRLRELRASVATASRYGVFRIQGNLSDRNRSAQLFADQIRMLKGYDPTLGLYAAYAYAEADIINEVRSVQQYMRSDLDTDLFDVAMLSGLLSDKPVAYTGYEYPFCPMLSQGWSLLRVSRVRLLPGVDSARAYLRPALWTTFDKPAMNTLIQALATPVPR